LHHPRIKLTNARRPIKGSKDADFRLVSFQRKKQKLPLAVGAQGTVTSKPPQTYPNYDVTHKKRQIQNYPTFLSKLQAFLHL